MLDGNSAFISKLSFIQVLGSHDDLRKKYDLYTVKRILSYLLELAECDLNYDVRDRARFVKQLLSPHLGSQGVQEETSCLPGKMDLPLKLVECMFRGQKRPMLSEPINYRFYLPGSLSQIVFHAAPGYEPLPKPRDLLCGDFSKRSALMQGASDSDSYETDDPDNVSGSLDEESSSGYSSQQSVSGSIGSGDTGSASESDTNVNAGSLINFSDVATVNSRQNEVSKSGSDDLENLMSKRALESWLDEKLDLSKSRTSEESQIRKSSAKILIGDFSGRVKPKNYILIDPANGNGLKVDYSYSSEISSISSLLVCIDVLFENRTKEPMTKVLLVDEESDKSMESADQLLASTER